MVRIQCTHRHSPGSIPGQGMRSHLKLSYPKTTQGEKPATGLLRWAREGESGVSSCGAPLPSGLHIFLTARALASSGVGSLEARIQPRGPDAPSSSLVTVKGQRKSTMPTPTAPVCPVMPGSPRPGHTVLTHSAHNGVPASCFQTWVTSSVFPEEEKPPLPTELVWGVAEPCTL